MFSVIKTKRVWFSLSAILFALSIAAVAIWGFKLGIDFTGGSLMEVSLIGAKSDQATVSAAASSVVKENPQVQPVGESGYIIRTPFIDENKHQQVIASLKKIQGVTDLKEERFETIGPTVSAELKNKAIWSVIVVLAAIVVYISWAFRGVSRPLSSWKYGVVAVVALLHDVFIPAGIFALLGKFAGYEVDTLFVTAILTILGFSVHDTIVTFDRIREHLKKTPKADFSHLVDVSVKETIGRSINTSMTVLLVLIPVHFFGGESIKQFTLVLILGVVFGTYSSIFIACPLLDTWNNLARSRN